MSYNYNGKFNIEDTLYGDIQEAIQEENKRKRESFKSNQTRGTRFRVNKNYLNKGDLQIFFQTKFYLTVGPEGYRRQLIDCIYAISAEVSFRFNKNYNPNIKSTSNIIIDRFTHLLNGRVNIGGGQWGPRAQQADPKMFNLFIDTLMEIAMMGELPGPITKFLYEFVKPNGVQLEDIGTTRMLDRILHEQYKGKFARLVDVLISMGYNADNAQKIVEAIIPYTYYVTLVKPMGGGRAEAENVNTKQDIEAFYSHLHRLTGLDYKNNKVFNGLGEFIRIAFEDTLDSFVVRTLRQPIAIREKLKPEAQATFDAVTSICLILLNNIQDNENPHSNAGFMIIERYLREEMNSKTKGRFSPKAFERDANLEARYNNIAFVYRRILDASRRKNRHNGPRISANDF